MTSDETLMFTDRPKSHAQHVSLNNKRKPTISCRYRDNEIVERRKLSCRNYMAKTMFIMKNMSIAGHEYSRAA